MDMNVNDILLKNVTILSKHSEKEDGMMPEGWRPTATKIGSNVAIL